MVMRTLMAAGVLLLVAGCGSNGADQRTDEAPCVRSAPAKVIGRAELRQGSGPVAVKVTDAGSTCGHKLFIDEPTFTAQLDLGDVELDPAGAQAVTVPGRDGQLLAAQEIHPRGGTQWHLYGVEGDRLSEILAGGQPPIPFIATDTQPQPPMTVACHGTGLRILQARAHEPAGVLFTWDLDRIDVAITGNEATVSGPTEIGDNLVPSIMARQHLDLVKKQMFVGCS